MKPTVPTICLGPSMTWPHLPQTPFHTPLLLDHCTPALLTSLTFRHLATLPSSLQPQGLRLFSSPPGTSSVKLSLAVSSITSRSPLQRYHLRDGFALLLIVKPDPYFYLQLLLHFSIFFTQHTYKELSEVTICFGTLLFGLHSFLFHETCPRHSP